MIPRIGLIWLLTAQTLVLMMHIRHLPVWVLVLWVFCTVWRLQILRMRIGYPKGWVKVLLVIAVVMGIFASRRTLVGLEAATALLVCTFVLKLLEMRSGRDALVLVFLGFFVLVTGYLFNDSLLSGLYSLLPAIALLAALIGLQQSSVGNRPLQTARLATLMLLQAVPLMLVLFIFFPRFDPLWSLPLPDRKGITGLTDSMDPGDLAQLGQSSELVFRASFKSALPPAQESLYWRALTLERFDGRRWSQFAAASEQRPAQWVKQGEALDYEIVMQATGKPWLFALDVGETTLDDAVLMRDFRLQRQQPVNQMLLYSVTSWPAALRDPQRSQRALWRSLVLPEQGNPQARAWAVELKERYPQPDALVRALMEHFNRNPYIYTLKPGPLGQDSIDEFLFETRRGFCAHYAGATTFVLRAAGIPARMVAGYQGGEYNPAGNYVQVRQFDAHAWVEYWQPEQGWRSVDPTFQVAPERIERGLEAALGAEQRSLSSQRFSLLHYRDYPWLNQMRMSWDRLNYNWQRWVLGYQRTSQDGFLQKWFGTFDSKRLALALVGGGALCLMLVALLLFKPWRHSSNRQYRFYRRFIRLLRRYGVDVSTAEGPRACAERAVAVLPEQSAEIQAFVMAFEKQCYAGQPVAEQELRQCLRALRRALPWRLSSYMHNKIQ